MYKYSNREAFVVSVCKYVPNRSCVTFKPTSFQLQMKGKPFYPLIPDATSALTECTFGFCTAVHVRDVSSLWSM